MCMCMLQMVGKTNKGSESIVIQATEAPLMCTESRNLAIKRREIESQLVMVIGSNEDTLVFLFSRQDRGMHTNNRKEDTPTMILVKMLQRMGIG